MGKAVLVVLAIALFVYSAYDLAATRREDVRLLPKTVWFLVLLLTPVGPVLWLLLGQHRALPPAPRRAGPPPRPLGPDDDPDYLSKL